MANYSQKLQQYFCGVYFETSYINKLLHLMFYVPSLWIGHNEYNPFEGNEPSLHGGNETVEIKISCYNLFFNLIIKWSVKIVDAPPSDHNNYSDLYNLQSFIAGHTLM